MFESLKLELFGLLQWRREGSYGNSLYDFKFTLAALSR